MKKYYSFDKNLNLKYEKGQKPRHPSGVGNFHLANYLNIGYYLITPILIGVFLGYITKYFLFFIILGTIGTFYNLIKIYINARDSHQDAGNQHQS